jgi:hypothetical protein
MTIRSLVVAALIVSALASLLLGARLKAIADRLPPTDDPIEHTSVYFLGRVGADPQGRRLVRWFWVAQASLFVAFIALIAS